MTAARVWLMAAFILSAQNAEAGELHYATVFDVKGQAEISRGAGRWKPLKKDASLPKGSRVRTGPNAEVHVVFDTQLESVIRLGANSLLKMTGAPNHVTLENGCLFAVMEGDSSAGSPAHARRTNSVFTVATRDLRAHLETGGASFEVSKAGTSAKTFGGTLKITPLMDSDGHSRLNGIEEGFKFFASASEGRARFERMQYADYADWQPWARAWYGKKDDYLADAFDKDMARALKPPKKKS